MHPNLRAERRIDVDPADADAPMTRVQKLALLLPWAALLLVGILLIS